MESRKWYRWSYLQSRNRDKDIGKTHMDTKGERRAGMYREFGLCIYTVLCIKWIINKNLLYTTGNSTWYSVESYMGRKSKKEGIYLCVWLIHFVQQKLTQQHIATVLQLKKMKYNKTKMKKRPGFYSSSCIFLASQMLLTPWSFFFFNF